ncbi:MAG: CoA activase [Gemmatimonadota bacterium]|nr:MAG: CoA activase [Gemmatimonadota bacterium]
MEKKIFIGIDVGSVSAKIVIFDEKNSILEDHYNRTKGQPLPTVLRVMEDILTRFSPHQVSLVAVTGSGGELLANLLRAEFVNEIVAQARSVGVYYPQVRTVIEMGGQDSKLLLLEEEPGDGGARLTDFAMNAICAAGTGSFLDQQASRMGLSIEEEFGQLALKSERPPRIAGRCSVFAKSDMIHLQQIGTPDYDIVAGLCYAVARSFKSNVGRGKSFKKPVAFQGGVAANLGVVKAFRDVLDLKDGELIIPEHFASMGAIGAVLVARERKTAIQAPWPGLDALRSHLKVKQTPPEGLEKLSLDYELANEQVQTKLHPLKGGAKKTEAYVGIDIGSLSTNVVVLDKEKNVLARRYLRTAGRPLLAVCRGLEEVGRELGDRVTVCGVGTTGSGRYLSGDYVGADVVRNEITAQATAAIHFDPDVDTIFEIGGQDSKYISIDNGIVVDFEMNKVCAAGTGSFLEEQAERLDINIVGEFGDLALQAKTPGRFGDRCTVFMESDLVSYQQKGAEKEDLVAGLGYSIVYNYLNKVVGEKRIGNKIFFQGAVAWNSAVVAAFEKVLGKRITVPPHHDVTGAIGVAILAMKAKIEGPSRFKGFDLSHRKYTTTSFECKKCENRCDVRKVVFENERPLFYGPRCERYEVDEAKGRGADLPDLFGEREHLLLTSYEGQSLPTSTSSGPQRQRVGMPRVLHFYELYPLWKAFFSELGFEVVLSETTNRQLIHSSVENDVADTCFPVKIVYGHIMDLFEKGVDYIFLPSIINMARSNPNISQNYVCPLVQALPYTIHSAIRFDGAGPQLLTPPILFQRGEKHIEQTLVRLGKSLGRTAADVKSALRIAKDAQSTFYENLRRRGREVMKGLSPDQRAVVIISRPYNGCDPGINLDLPKKLKDMGVLAIPMDFLSLEDQDISTEFPNMYWKYGQRILSAAEIVRSDPRLHVIYISNFKCGPDSFIEHYVRAIMTGKPYLQLEIDEHSADAGTITRCEAFFDSLENEDQREISSREWHEATPSAKGLASRTIFVPHMSDHAYAISAALRHYGLDSEVLPESDDETVRLGREHASGKECFPFIVTTGDIVKKVQEPSFDPNRTAFLMPSASGPCRFGQYNRMDRIILGELGYPDIPIISPSSRNSYSEFGDLGNGFQRRAWRGIVAVDLLQKLLWETRPYEINRGETEKVYKKCLKLIEDELAGTNGNLAGVLGQIKERFQKIPVDKKTRKPIVGVVGEIFIRSNRFSNNDVVTKIESLGGEAWVAPISEWVLYTNHRFKEDSLAYGVYTDFVKGWIKDRVQRYDEHTISKPFKDMLLNIHEPPTSEVLGNSARYMHHTFGGEAILSIGKAADYVKKGLSGIVNVMPFTCMPGMVVIAISKRFREDYDNVPWLNLAYDGQEETQSLTRLEAFMHQVTQFHQRKKE